MDNQFEDPKFAVVDDGRVFTIALISSLTWSLAAQNPIHGMRSSFVSLLASMLMIYLFGTPLARIAYQLFGKRPKAARMTFMIVALAIVGIMAACG